MQKGQILIWIIVGALVIIVVAVAYYLGRSSASRGEQTSQITPSPASSPDETTEWKIYTNPNLKFTVKYPSDWEAFQKKDSTETFTVGFGEIGDKDYKGDPLSIVDIVAKEDLKGKVIDLEKIPNTAGMEEVMGYFEKSLMVDKYFEWSDTIIGGIKAKRVDHLYCQSGSCHSVLFKRNNKVYGITMNQGGEKFMKIFSQILATFRFD